MGGPCSPLARALLVLVMLLLLDDISSTICPTQCSCNNEELRTTCVAAGLQVVPNQFNPDVKHINLSRNKINNVHYTFNYYRNLITLDLSFNKIQTLGSINFELQHHLKKLNLSENELSNLSKDAFKGLRSLIELDLSSNQLEELRAHSFQDLFALETLILTGNQLTTLESDLLRPATRLRELILDDNKLLEVPGSAIGEAILLHRLSLSGNQIASIQESALSPLPSLKILLLDSNLIGDIHHNALAGLPALEHLDLSDNNFTSISTASLSKLVNLTTLQLSRNLITTIPPVAFRGLFQLRYLYLDRLEKLTRIDSRAFVDNINLEHVWMDYNYALATIPTRLFHGNPHVVFISIRNNSLSTIDASHFPLDQLRILRLGGNPLLCNCSLLWLWRLEREQLASNLTRGNVVGGDFGGGIGSNSNTNGPDLVIDVDGIFCEAPEPLKHTLLSEAAESQIICSLNWVAVITASTLVGAFLMMIILALYLRRRMQKRELSDRENTPCQGGAGLRLEYDHPSNDKYIMGAPPLYRALPPWETVHKEADVDIYRQFDITKSRPHIVYV